jgi:formylglycine-generating enzyme required for sulfatase activity
METITVHTRDIHVALAAHPVARQEFKAYLAARDQPIPAPLARGDSPASPVTYVSQVDAASYCHWLGAQQGRSYRLPTMAELHELAEEITQEGINPEVWPHTHQPHPEIRGGMRPTYLCEWTQETEDLPQFGDNAPGRRLGSVFYPPWVRQGSNASHAQAYLAATEGYSFVTFRLAYAL